MCESFSTPWQINDEELETNKFCCVGFRELFLFEARGDKNLRMVGI